MSSAKSYLAPITTERGKVGGEGEGERRERERYISHCKHPLYNVYAYYIHTHDLINHKVLRKTRKGNATQQKDKVTQHNTTCPRQSFFKEKLLPQVGLQPTTVCF